VIRTSKSCQAPLEAFPFRTLAQTAPTAWANPPRQALPTALLHLAGSLTLPFREPWPSPRARVLIRCSTSILTFDSFGHSHPKVVATIVEWLVRVAIDKGLVDDRSQLSTDNVRYAPMNVRRRPAPAPLPTGSVSQVHHQDNGHDCGPYAVQSMRFFFEGDPASVEKAAKKKRAPPGLDGPGWASWHAFESGLTSQADRVFKGPDSNMVNFRRSTRRSIETLVTGFLNYQANAQ
jgi:hypothetical protein